MGFRAGLGARGGGSAGNEAGAAAAGLPQPGHDAKMERYQIENDTPLK